MARNFYFGSDASMVSGSAVFSAGINSDPSALGLSPDQCVAYAAIDATLQAAYLAATTPHTRTPVAVAHKNESLKAMQLAAKSLAAVILLTPTVTDAQLLSLGLLPRTKRTRRTVSSTPPRVQVMSVIGRMVTLRISDADSSSRRSKPFAATGSQIYSYVGENPPTDARDYEFEGHFSRTTAQLVFRDEVPSGATIWLSAKWISARGETSFASTPLNFTLQGGPVTAASSSLSLAA